MWSKYYLDIQLRATLLAASARRSLQTKRSGARSQEPEARSYPGVGWAGKARKRAKQSRGEQRSAE